MRSVKLIVFVLLSVAAPLAWSQGGNPPASTKESGQTSGRGYTAVEQTFKGNAEEQIRTLQEQGREAALKGDASFLEKYLAGDYVGILGDGRMITKDQAIQMRTSGDVKYESIDIHEMKIRTYGNTAIANALASVKLTANGKPISGNFHSAFIWVKQGSNWKMVSAQSTPVTSGSQ